MTDKIERVCLECDNTIFREQEVDCKPVIKGEVVEVKSKAFVCIKCGFQSMDSKQLNELRKAGEQAYKETSDNKR